MNARLTTAGGRVSVPTHREVSDATVNPDMRKMTYTSALVGQTFCMFLVICKCDYLDKEGVHRGIALNRIDLCGPGDWTPGKY